MKRKPVLLIRSLLLVSALSLSPCLHAGQGVWSSNGPYGAHVYSIVIHPTRPGEALMLSGGDPVLFRTTNGGNSWKEVPTPDLFSFVAIHPSLPSRITAVSLHSFTNPVVLYTYESLDDGATWQNVSTTTIEPHYFYSVIDDFKANPSSPTVFYVHIVGAGVFKSSDAGRTWMRQMRGLPARILQAKLDIDPSNSDIAYLAFGDGSVYKTTDGAQSWNRSGRGIKHSDHNYSTSVQVDPLQSGIVYAASEFLSRSTDAGATWQNVPCPCGYGVRSFQLDSRNPSTVYLVSTVGAFKSVDGARTWKKLDPPATTLYTNIGIFVSPLSSDFIYIGSRYDLARSTTAGASWQVCVNGVSTEKVWRLDASSKPTVILLAQSGFDLEKIFASAVGGAWRRMIVSTVSDSQNQGFVAGEAKVHPLDSRFIVVDNGNFGGKIALTRDQGKTWTHLHTPSSSSFELDPVKPGVIYLNTPAKSTDFGATWKMLKFFSEPHVPAVPDFLRIDPTNTSRIYAVLKANVYVSVNAGASFRKLSSVSTQAIESLADLQIDPKNPQFLYGAGFEGIFKSVNSGKTWTLITRGLPGYSLAFVTVNPFDTSNLFCSGAAPDLFVSYDAAQTWSRFNTEGLGGAPVNHVIVDPRNPRRLLAATDRGVFTYTLP